MTIFEIIFNSSTQFFPPSQVRVVEYAWLSIRTLYCVKYETYSQRRHNILHNMQLLGPGPDLNALRTFEKLLNLTYGSRRGKSFLSITYNLSLTHTHFPRRLFSYSYLPPPGSKVINFNCCSRLSATAAITQTVVPAGQVNSIRTVA